MPLQTGPDRANVRRGPGMDFEVLHTLEPETELVGQSYSGEWVRVADDGGREGWIFHTLVTAR
ncbi:MAG: SH3 domain-containing protein [Gemmatimonadetes bacterium]|nr:SH3 domain-containing protein [Gemmatimonadota bacterium]